MEVQEERWDEACNSMLLCWSDSVWPWLLVACSCGGRRFCRLVGVLFVLVWFGLSVRLLVGWLVGGGCRRRCCLLGCDVRRSLVQSVISISGVHVMDTAQGCLGSWDQFADSRLPRPQFTSILPAQAQITCI